MDGGKQDGTQEVPRDEGSPAESAHRDGGSRAAQDDDVPQEEKGGRRTGRNLTSCAFSPSTPRCATAPRAKPSAFPPTIKSWWSTSWTSWGSITSRAAGRGRIP